LERLFQDDSERFLRRLRDRIDMVGIELPTIEVRYEQLMVEADVIAAGRALPTLWNAATNFLQVLPCIGPIIFLFNASFAQLIELLIICVYSLTILFYFIYLHRRLICIFLMD
jgi:hypothetical protein